MVTAEEVPGIPLFASLPGAERELLSDAADDVSLPTGEFAVNEGGERGLCREGCSER